ncbi:uncharacterized protein N7515_002866 [Penicillium bovifimosum]|uniref:Uncharacterized protein n=1 Tax=Penicillium bovifimosum TaxID=126998 RepID=A0A9W9HCQ7_9EURO|nr:uncharacterized protein N7515_002866 [Penicillium bovifimosum]KAJ5144079.1 hypothetical protein N7515_002866 [Penicillium bovifimosum]
MFFTGALWRPELMQARELNLQFNQTVELDEVVRQQGESEKAFRQALDNLRMNEAKVEDWRLCASQIAIQSEPS